jgi:hypothetical protein
VHQTGFAIPWKSHQRRRAPPEDTGQRDRLSSLQLVRQRTGKALHDILRGLGKPYQADDAAAFQRLDPNRQDRVEHLGGISANKLERARRNVSLEPASAVELPAHDDQALHEKSCAGI